MFILFSVYSWSKNNDKLMKITILLWCTHGVILHLSMFDHSFLCAHAHTLHHDYTKTLICGGACACAHNMYNWNVHDLKPGLSHSIKGR